jgi:hypothetical protein
MIESEDLSQYLVNLTSVGKNLISEENQNVSVNQTCFGSTTEASITSTTNDSKQKILLELNPRWEEKRRLYHLRLKTLFRIFISKWFYLGLEWYEKELLLLLTQKLPKVDCSVLNRVVYQSQSEIVGYRKIAILASAFENEGEKSLPIVKGKVAEITAINIVGQFLYCELEDTLSTLYNPTAAFDVFGEELFSYIYTLEEFRNVWKLRSFQSLRDTLFIPFQARSLGKKGVKRTRIRGYTDGRGSAGDPKRVKLARQLDVLFWTDTFETKWNNFYEDIERMSQF